MCKRTFQRGIAWRKGTSLTVDGTVACVWYFDGLKEKKRRQSANTSTSSLVSMSLCELNSSTKPTQLVGFQSVRYFYPWIINKTNKNSKPTYYRHLEESVVTRDHSFQVWCQLLFPLNCAWQVRFPGGKFMILNSF